MTDFTFNNYRETSFVTSPENLHERIDELIALDPYEIKLTPLIMLDLNDLTKEIGREWSVEAQFYPEEETDTLVTETGAIAEEEASHVD